MTLKQSTNPYGYKELLVYKKAETLQSDCARFTSHFPPFSNSAHSKTLSALADQMDRSARSVKQNIVEGWKRNSTKEYHQFLGFSLGANAELEEDCNDIIKGIYAEMGLKGVMGERGAAGAARPPQGAALSVPSSQTLSSHSAHSSPSTLDEVERLPFYPLDYRLPPVVQLKLRCKELNMLLDKLQKSLVDKMSADHTLGQREMQQQALGREAANDAWIRKEREKWEREEREKGEKKGERGFVKVSLTTVLAFAILTLPFIFRPYVVTGGSMEPAYHEGQVVWAEKLTPHFHVWRGEVLVIRNPHDKRVVEIKRVIGLPGELVEMGSEGVTVIRECKGEKGEKGEERGETGECSVSFPTGTIIGGEFNGTFRIKLGPEDYFVLGDNRSKSSDSRTFGAVQKTDIIGSVLWRITP